MHEKELLQYCLQKVAERASRYSVSDWTDGNFIELSEAIEEETGILISRNTLKRLFGKMKTPDDYRPQKETKNALARYAGSESWPAFRDKWEARLLNKSDESAPQDGAFDPSPDPVLEEDPLTGQTEPAEGYPSPSFTWLAVILMLGIMVFAVFFWKFRKTQTNPGAFADKTGIFLRIRNPVDTIPFTMVADYTFYPTESLEFLINDLNLSPNTRMISLGQVEPNFSWLILKRDSIVFGSQSYHAISRNWMAFYQQLGRKTKHPVPVSEYREGGIAGLHPSYFEGKTADSTQFFLFLEDARNYKANIDHFSAEWRIRIPSPEGWCQGFHLKLMGDKANMELGLYPEGCGNRNFFYLPGQYLDGKYHDLHTPSMPANRWVNVRLETGDGKARFLLDSTLVRESPYPGKAGWLKAIHLKVGNFSQVDYFRVWDHSGELVENEEFH